MNQCRPDLFTSITYPPFHGKNEFKDSKNRRKRKAHKAFNGWATILQNSLIEPFHYTLYPSHLGFNSCYNHYLNIFRWLQISQLVKKIREEFKPPFYYKFEVCEGTEISEPWLHCHLVAEKDAGLIHLPRTIKKSHQDKGGLVTSVYDYQGLIEYLSKPKLARSPELEKALFDEKLRLMTLQTNRFPKTSNVVWS